MAGGISFADQKPQDKTTLKEVRQEVKEVVETMENYSAAQRADALEKIRTAIDELDTRIADLEARVEKNWEQMDQAARDKSRATLKSLKKKRNELAEWYGGLRYSSINAWQHVKKGFLDSYEALYEAYDKAVKEF
jgi:methyl-accepting chemotaxis protein